MKSPLDEAIVAAEPLDLAGWRKLDEVPFDFERRRVSVLVEHDGQRRLIVKGAPEDLLRLSERYENATEGMRSRLTTRPARPLRPPSTGSAPRGSAHWESPVERSTATTISRR